MKANAVFTVNVLGILKGSEKWPANKLQQFIVTIVKPAKNAGKIESNIRGNCAEPGD